MELFFWIPAFAGMTYVYSIMTHTYSISSFQRTRESPAAAGLPRLIEMLLFYTILCVAVQFKSIHIQE